MQSTVKRNLFMALAVALLLAAGVFLGVFGLFNAKERVDGSAPSAQSNSSGPDGELASANQGVPTESYAPQLWLAAKWGSGPGEVGISNPSSQAEDAGPSYGPQSFDLAEDGRLFLLDSVNQRVMVYDAAGRYAHDFPIACGGTGDIRVAPDQQSLYVFSWRCGGAVLPGGQHGRGMEGEQFPRRAPGRRQLSHRPLGRLADR